MLDGGSAVTENLRDADLVQGDIGWAESCEPVVGVPAEPSCTGLRLTDQFGGGGPLPLTAAVYAAASRRVPYMESRAELAEPRGSISRTADSSSSRALAGRPVRRRTVATARRASATVRGSSPAWAA